MIKVTDYISLTDREEYRLILEALRAPLCWLSFVLFGLAFCFFYIPMAYAAFFILIPSLWIDFKHMILPDVLTVLFFACAICFAPISLNASLIGAGVGLGLFMALEIIMTRTLGRPALGWGDVKLLGALGAWGGILSLPLILLFASWSATFFVIYHRLVKPQDKSNPFPFGPFLIIGGFIAVIYQSQIWNILTTLY